MPAPDDGCLLCGSTWGDYYAEVAGARRFFCCELCAVQYRTILREAARLAGAERIVGVDLEGGRTGRLVTARLEGGRSVRFRIVFNALSELRTVSLLGP